MTSEPTVWEIMHRKLGTWESQGLVYWNSYLRGEVEYDDFARLDVRTWAGTSVSELEEAARQVPTMPGVEELLPALVGAGLSVALISNGLLELAEHIAGQYGVQHVFANRALHRDGKLTGELDILVPYESKGAVLTRLMSRLGLSPENVAAVGDARADLAMFQEAGLSIAFRPVDSEVAGKTHAVFTENLGELLAVLL